MSDETRGWYAAYLETRHWKRLRAAKLEQASYRCERCGEHARRGIGGVWRGLSVHHRTYERVRNERLDDLEVLCVACHADEHNTARAPDINEQVRRRIADSTTTQTLADPLRDLEEESWAQSVADAELGVES